MMIPKDPIILVSYLNTQLRDYYPSLEELCKSLGVDSAEIQKRLADIDYRYDEIRNQFV